MYNVIYIWLMFNVVYLWLMYNVIYLWLMDNKIYLQLMYNAIYLWLMYNVTSLLRTELCDASQATDERPNCSYISERRHDFINSADYLKCVQNFFCLSNYPPIIVKTPAPHFTLQEMLFYWQEMTIAITYKKHSLTWHLSMEN